MTSDQPASNEKRRASSDAGPPRGRQPADREGRRRRPVQAYIAAMPGWKRDVGPASTRSSCAPCPTCSKAVRWNSPFYGVEGQGWFLSFHCFTKYVKVTFFRGTSLRPLPPGESRSEEMRYLDVHEDEQLDEELVASWIRQAAELPGWVP